MKLLIEKSDLELLLEKKRDLIGNKVTIDTIIAGISFLLSVFTASYSDIFGISGTVLNTVFCLIGIGYGTVGTAHNGSTERTGGNTCQNSSFPFSAQGIESEHTIVGRYFHKSNLLSENGKDL